MDAELVGNTAYETKNLTLLQRFNRSGSWMFWALLLAAYALSVFIEGYKPLGYGIAAAAASALLSWFTWKKWSERIVTELATVSVPPSQGKRLIGYLGCGFSLLFCGALVIFGDDASSIPIGLMFLLLAILWAWAFFLPKEKLTPAAQKEKARLETAENDGFGEVVGMLFGWTLALGAVVLLFMYAPWWAAVIIVLLVLVLFK